MIMQRWNAVQYDVLPELRAEVGVVTFRSNLGAASHPIRG
jgi:hypothetical protein